MDATSALEGIRLWALLVAFSGLAGLVLYFGFGGALYYLYYVRRRDDAASWKIQPKRFLKPELERWAVRVAAANLGTAGIVTGSLMFYWSRGGYSQLYYDIGDFGYVYTALSTVGTFVVIEAIAYYTHRWLHGKWMFKHVHVWHHRCVAPHPLTTVTMHPFEFFTFQATIFIPLFIYPIWAPAFGALLVYVLIFNIMDHSGIMIRHKIPWQSSSKYHDDHHVYFHCNYGQNLMFFDRFHGTLRRKSRRYGKDIFGGKGAPADGEGTPPADDDFVEY